MVVVSTWLSTAAKWCSWTSGPAGAGRVLPNCPNVRAVYDHYHNDGFEVVGVSLDFQRAQLVQFLEAHPESWPQIFFDEAGQRGFDNPLARLHHVDAIPCLLLIARDGMLVDRGLRGQQIGVAVAKA